MAFVEATDLELGYRTDRGELRAVHGVSFAIPEAGEALGIIGETGSGKTSLLYALTRVYPRNVSHVAGSLLLDGRDVNAIGEHEYRRQIRWKEIAVVFQAAMNGFNPVVRVGRQIIERALAEPGISEAKAKDRAMSLLESVGLGRAAYDRFPHELSGGMKQRAAIAMALILEPSLLILDEPTSALDVSVQAQIMNTLKSLKWERNLSMIFITHDIALASDLCDRLAVMYAGQVREQGTAEEILGDPQDPYTRELLANIPRLDDGGASARGPGRRAPREVLAGGGIGMSALLRVGDLKAYYYQNEGLLRRREIRAVDGVSFELAKAETLAVVGESGSGKSTLGRAVLRLTDIAGGSVQFDGRDLLAARRRDLAAVRRRAQAIFQDPYSSISPFMSVYDTVEEPLLIHRIGDPTSRRERILRTLTRVKLDPPDEVATKYPHALSGGQRQRVSIARAMVLEPDLIVADEPVSMVDASNRAEILTLLAELQTQTGAAFLYITHDIANARHFSDRIAVMYAGTIVETGSTAEVIDRPLHPYTKALLAAVPNPDPANRLRLRDVIPGEPPSGGVVPSGCPFHSRCPAFQAGRCEVARPALKEPTMGTVDANEAGAPATATGGGRVALSGGTGRTALSGGQRGSSRAPHLVACVLYEERAATATTRTHVPASADNKERR